MAYATAAVCAVAAGERVHAQSAVQLCTVGLRRGRHCDMPKIYHSACYLYAADYATVPNGHRVRRSGESAAVVVVAERHHRSADIRS